MTPLAVEGGMAAICAAVAAAKGWTLREAAERTLANFEAFYASIRVK